ncbi:MAG TPA: methyltransferase domain-containing protein, partial [Pirellulales bacterium]
PAVAIHYHHDETGRGLAPETARLLAEAAIRSGRTPVLLSWNRRPPVADASDFEAEILGSVAWRGWGLGDAETLAALIDSVELMVGIDAAPLRFAMATDTPTIAVWTGESPWSAIEPSPNVEHWLPHAGAHEALAPAVRRTVAARHAHRLYRELEIELPTEIEHRLTGRAGAVAVSHAVRERRRGRREFAAAGPERFRELQGWEDFGRALDYGRWIVPALALAGRRVLDVGAGCGAIVQAFGRAGAVVQGVECQEAWVERGQARWPDMAPLLHAADPTNLPFFADASWDAIHAGQFTDPLPFALVPAVLAEFRRLVVDGGRLFLRVDVRDGRAASGVRSSAARPAPNDVPTLAWWREQLKAAGWEDVSSDWSSRLVSAPLSFLSQYDWNWFVARRATQLSGEPS